MKNNAANWGGLVTLMICIAIATLFFIFVLVGQPGPVDVQPKPVVGLTYDQYLARKEGWTQSTPEAIARGQESYQLNCVHCHAEGNDNPILARFQAGASELKYGKTELEIFSVITKGLNNGSTMKRMNHLPENERWDLVHYLRSLNKDLPTTKKSDWKIYFSEQGI